MSLDLRPSRACLVLVQQFEGLRPRAARLSDGGWTVGYGHTLTAREGAVVSAEDAHDLLLYDLTRVGELVRETTFTPLNQNQFDALTAFAFNIGADTFQASDVLKRVNAGDLLGAASAIERWCVAQFEGEALVVDGLVRRRAAEKALFLTPPEGFRFVPTPVVRPERDGAARPTADVGGAAELQSPMTGDLAVAERVGPALVDEPPPVERAAHSVSARLQRLFPEGEEPARAEPPPPPELPPFPVAEPPPPPFPREASPLAETEPLFAHPEAPPLPPTPEIGPGDPFGAVDAGAEPVSAGPRGFAEEARGVATPQRGRAYTLVGLVGLALFVLAIAWMLLDHATTLNLLLGLAGVACMAPAGAALVLPRLHRGGERGAG